MIYLRTGMPGASKTLNSLADLISGNDGTRPIYYTNIRLFMLDFAVCSTFSGWFYGLYFPQLKDKTQKKKLIKVMKRVHADDEFCELKDLPWLESLYEASNPLDVWLHWARKLYSKAQLRDLENYIENFPGTDVSFEHLERFNLHFTRFDNAREWYKLPKGSIILIDECQQFFPPRPVGAKVPEHISEFETHRHKGFDVHLVTQNAKLMDVNIRRLTGRHIHYFNPFGGERVTRYQAPKCLDTDNYFDLKESEKNFSKRPSKLYGCYYSAEIHTHKFRIPKFAYYGLGLIVAMIASIYGMVWVFDNMSPDAQQSAESEKKAVISERVSYRDKVVEPVLDAEKQSIIKYVSSVIDGVFIDGYVIEVLGSYRNIHYTFSKKLTGESFDPLSVGFTVIPIKPCFARFQLYDFTTFVTCDPFYKAPTVKEKNDSSSDDGSDFS